MLRKSKASANTAVKSEHIVPRNRHCISKTDISSNALKVLNRLTGAGFQAYLVGGSVRDLLLHKVPKDFDVATNATPSEVKKLFRNGRIIGRRFKLVHILFHREIIEVATFRAQSDVIETNERGMLIRDNVFGTLEQDAWRRDFTINSLYYNINDSSIIDLTGGVNDIEQGIIRMIGDPELRYQEDPVRMLRALRFSAKLGFELAEDTSQFILKLNHLITHVSGSRLFDEITKLYQCGEAESVQRLLLKYGLFERLFPLTFELLNSNYPINAFLGIALGNTDTRIRDEKPVTPAFLMAVLLWFPMLERSKQLQKEGLHPLPALEKAMSQIIIEQNQTVFIPKRFSQVIREIWLLQFRFNKRFGKRPLNLIQHPRFRAAYDFMALRALSGDESMELANWWTLFQDVDSEKQMQMIEETSKEDLPKPRKKRRKPKPPQNHAN
ncbi:polynucleotide adenylyltransferase PcnB [Legionella israelensis]|uniref:Poly(A) polymerase I n=1 Tax=Legionella israelensis TaxID=454 RepID=A0AAX1EHL9_9GAMM|nr:polynucleotide adenylyltransferase PcnB [Legionella israelensis]QBR84372.1 polynucleotide adenylyltransferase PcnB [Legionella israelensis]